MLEYEVVVCSDLAFANCMVCVYVRQIKRQRDAFAPIILCLCVHLLARESHSFFHQCFPLDMPGM